MGASKVGNILLTNYCNRRCIYCFALDKVSAGAEDDGERRQSLKVEDFHHYLDFMRRSRLRVLSLLGGEPTLHPHFREIMDLCKTAPYVDHIKLFTNGLLPEPLLAYLIDYEGPALNIILNIHHPSEYPSGQWDKLTKFMMGLGDKIALGYNIYQTGNDFGFLLELFRQYKISHHVRLGLTQPILGANNIHLPLESLPDVAQEIVAAAHLFTREGLFFSFDCGFPFCMFSLDQHKELLSCAIKFRSSCNPVVDIGPDLSVWCCFPLSSIHNRHLQQFETRMDIEYYYSELFRPYRQFGIYPRCTECDYKIQGLCSGGCLSRVLREFQGGVVEEALVQQLAQGSP